MKEFIPGLELSERYYKEVIVPILDKSYPDLAHSAALIGHGSEVLGFDTPQSMDHDWAPRALIFLSEEDFYRVGEQLTTTLEDQIPKEYLGFPTRIRVGENSQEELRVEVHSIRSYFTGCTHEKDILLDPHSDPTDLDWLALPQQELLAITSGKIYHDGLGMLGEVRKRFAYFPKDVWLYLLASQWRKISQEEAFVGRAHQVGDELGSQIIAGRMVREIMRLCFLMERKYIPYSKWLGTSFAQLSCAEDLSPLLQNALLARDFENRERNLSGAYEYIARMHSALNITEPLPDKVSDFHGRPFKVIHGEVFEEAIKRKITSTQLKSEQIKFGSIDQFADSTDFLSQTALTPKIKELYKLSHGDL